MNVLLSVKPKYAEEIVSGRKKYDFRKSIFKRKDVEKMYIYSSSPVKKIIAIVEIDCILSDSPQKLWEQYHEYAGISKREFFDYFKNSDVGYAIKISNVQELTPPIDPYIDEDFRPPQSFYYLPMSYLQSYWEYQIYDINCGHGIVADSYPGYLK